MHKSKSIHYSFKDLIFLLLGVTATLQILRIKNITLYSYFLVIAFAFSITYKKIGKISKGITFFFISAVLSEISCFFIQINNSDAWQKASIRNFALYILTGIVTYYLCKNDRDRHAFFKGLKISCVIQLIWCTIQLIFSITRGININKLIFIDLLHSNVELQISSFYNGSIIVSGLNTNAGMLIPVLVLSFLIIDNYFCKILAIGLMFLSGSTSNVICGLAFLLLYFLFFRKNKKIFNKVSKRYLIIILLLLSLIGISFTLKSNLLNRINDNISILITRLTSARRGMYQYNGETDGSTFAHLRYYNSVPYIFCKENIFRIIFGYGCSCAGIPFTLYFNQYKDMIFVPESDPITFLYNFGLIGALIFYGILFQGVKKGYVVDKKYSLFFTIIIIIGIFYGVQMLWVIMIEWIFIFGISHKIKLKQYI